MEHRTQTLAIIKNLSKILQNLTPTMKELTKSMEAPEIATAWMLWASLSIGGNQALPTGLHATSIPIIFVDFSKRPRLFKQNVRSRMCINTHVSKQIFGVHDTCMIFQSSYK